jgi:hypothetical protein
MKEGKNENYLICCVCVCVCVCGRPLEKKKERKEGTLEKNLESLRKKNLEIKRKSKRV